MAMQFTAVTNAEPNTLVESNAVTVSGLTLGTKAVEIIGSGQLSVNGGAWGTTGVVQNGSTLKLRTTTPEGALGQITTVTVNLTSLGYIEWEIVNRNDLMVESGAGYDSVASIGIAPTNPIDEVAAGFDELIYNQYALVLEQGVGSEYMLQKATLTLILNEVGAGSDTPSPVIALQLDEVGTGEDALLERIFTGLSDQGFGQDDIIGVTRSTHMLFEVAAGYDTLVLNQRSESVEETGVGYDTLIPSINKLVLVVETGTASDSVVQQRENYALIVESGEGSDGTVTTLHIQQGVWDVAQGVDEVIIDYTDNLSHVFNIRTAAYSEWSGVQPLEVFSVDGKIYGLSPAGLYELADDFADAELYLGLVDFGTELLKLLPGAYLTAASNDVIRVAVNSVDQGEDVYVYEARSPRVDTPTQTRVDFGKGLRSRYFGVAIGNTPGASLRLLDAGFIVNATTRRA